MSSEPHVTFFKTKVSFNCTTLTLVVVFCLQRCFSTNVMERSFNEKALSIFKKVHFVCPSFQNIPRSGLFRC